MRIEKDFLGEMELADDVYYGVQTKRSIINFPISGRSVAPEMIHALGLIKLAAARANLTLGRLSPEIGRLLLIAAQEVMEGKMDDQFITDGIQGGAGTSVNMNANEVIANRALELLNYTKGRYDIISPNNHVNMAQSTNDVFPSALRIAAITLVDRLLRQLSLLRLAFNSKAGEFRNVLKMGRTHLQDAVPITLGQEFEAYVRVTKRAIDRIALAAEELYYLNMGATAVGTGLNAEPRFTHLLMQNINELSGREFKTPVNLVDATQNTDQIAGLSAALHTSALGFCKIASDLRLMASGPYGGFFEIRLPARQPGSSIMPGKVNPVMAEVLNQTCYAVIGNDLTISLAVENGQLELNVMEPVMADRLFDSLRILGNAVKVFREFGVDGIKANEERCLAMAQGSLSIGAALQPYIGYDTASRLVRQAQKTGRDIKDLVLAEKLLNPQDLSIILDPHNMTSPGIAGLESVVSHKLLQ